MAGGFQSDDDVISGINVTPLVDVVLVLLIIFLITAPVLYQSAIKVKLPSAKTGEQAEKSPLEFTITKEGDLSIGKEKLDWSQLGVRLNALGPNASEQTAIISADEFTPHGTVVKLMDSLRQAGITRFALNVESSAPPQAATSH
jgi:biopolymer transport protein ExbD